MFELGVIDLVDVFDFVLEVFVFLLDFGNGGTGYVELVGDTTELGLFLTEQVVEFFVLLVEFLDFISL